MGRDSGVNMPSCTQLVAQRTATELELAAARGYLDSLDDAAIWHLLREHRATATQWDSSVHQLQPPSPLASVLVEGVRYLHPVSSNRATVGHPPTSLLTVVLFLHWTGVCSTYRRCSNTRVLQRQRHWRGASGSTCNRRGGWYMHTRRFPMVRLCHCCSNALR